jgi:RNA polymerase sigma-70 factor (ECF subfamily)
VTLGPGQAGGTTADPGAPSPPAAPPETALGPPRAAARVDGQGLAAALVAAMARAQPAALESLYDLFAAELYGLILGMVGDSGEAQEILQETMWQAWRQSGRYDPARASVRTWLHVIMRSRVADWRRRRGTARAASDLSAAERVDDPASAGMFERVVDRNDLLQAQYRLSEAERQAIALTYYRGLSQAEAARALGIPLGTLKGRVRSALARLRAALDLGREGEG